MRILRIKALRDQNADSPTVEDEATAHRLAPQGGASVQLDAASGMHCWHLTVEPAHEGERYADVYVDTAKSRAVYEE